MNMWHRIQEIQYSLGKKCRLMDVTHPAYEFYHILCDLREMNT